MLLALVSAAALAAVGWVAAPGRSPRLPEPVWGVTIDDVEPIDELEEALDGFRTRLTARVVFDAGGSAGDYRPAVERLAEHAWIMGELVDSSDMKKLDRDSHHARVEEYWEEMGDLVDVWEIGNEVNGEWLGESADVAAKVVDANSYVKARGGRTAVTLFYNSDCWDDPDHEMFAWAGKWLPPDFRRSVDYAFISWYEEECDWRKPDFDSVFRRLGGLFPRSRLGFGEVGVRKESLKADYLKRYYGLKIKAPRYLGGYFWWFFNEDMIPKSRPMWRVLRDSVR